VTPINSLRRPLLAALAAAWLAGLVLSGWAPYDRLTWLMEVVPAMLALPLLLLTARRFPLSSLLLFLVLLHGLILMGGGAYTYARVPAGQWVQEAFGLARNPYDKLGHFAQGLVPALLAREILLRGFGIAQRRLAGFLAATVALAFSAFYEMIEWWAALAMGQGADEFLGTQGDQWDTQSDMMWAMIGAILAVTLLARWHDRSMARL
jgi:putative membrane protein